jgi:hypothetical protein
MVVALYLPVFLMVIPLPRWARKAVMPLVTTVGLLREAVAVGAEVHNQPPVTVAVHCMAVPVAAAAVRVTQL